MVLVKVLKRKDAASVVVAVAVGFVLYALAQSLAQPLANKFTAHNPTPMIDWRTQYVFPLVLALLELIALELLGWVYVGLSSMFNKK